MNLERLLWAISLLGVTACGGTESSDGPTRGAVEVVRDLLFEGSSFAVALEHERAPAALGDIVPSTDPSLARGPLAAHMPTIMMAPPCEVSFLIGPSESGELSIYAGVDRTVPGLVPKDTPPFRVEFEVLRGGETLWSESIRVVAGRPRRRAHWRERDPTLVPMTFAEGDAVTLRTRLGEGAPELPAGALRVGFGRPRILRRVTRELHPPSPTEPNLLLLVVDTLRSDRLGCYGYARGTSPHMDALAERGLLYEQAYATSSWTWPSTASLLTGLAPEAHGLGGKTSHLANGLVTLGEVIGSQGYRTAGFSGNPLVSPRYNFDQGFEEFISGDKAMDPSRELVPRVVKWIEAHRDERFFLHVQLVDPHAPHVPSPELMARFAGEPPEDLTDAVGPPSDLLNHYRRLLVQGKITAAEVPAGHVRWLSDAYDACVAETDQWIGVILDALSTSGLADRTVVALTSDHGEELLEHGLMGHSYTLHRELVRVPLILAGPGIPEGTRTSATTSNRHLAPTLARLAGAAPDAWPQAWIRAPDLAGSAPGRPVYFSTRRGFWNGELETELFGVRDGEWVLHWAPDRDGQARLFRAEDGEQRTDLSSDHPDRVARLVDAIRSRRERNLEAVPGEGTIGADVLESLEALGYFDEGGDED